MKLSVASAGTESAALGGDIHREALVAAVQSGNCEALQHLMELGAAPLVCEEKKVTWADGHCRVFEGVTPFNQPVAGKEGLQRPLLASGDPVTGSNKKVFRKECKRKTVRVQEEQPRQTYWSRSSRGQELKENFRRERPAHISGRCPAGLALNHPASDTLMDWATDGCPVETGRNWECEELQAAVDKRAPQVSDERAGNDAAPTRGPREAAQWASSDCSVGRHQG